MMDPIISTIDLQQAWQTAFQLRTCPDDVVLRAQTPDENLSRHLLSCSICRDKRAMPSEQVNAWQGLFNKFVPLVHQAVNTPQPGQVWILKKKLSRWGDDGYYYSPPNVLLIEKVGDTGAFRAAQLYSDKLLMSGGDVWLGDRFGFAQGWNSYTIQQGALECWLGNVTESQVAEVIHAGTLTYAPEEEHSILSFFREMEIKVGWYAIQPTAPEVLKNEEVDVFDLMPGLKLAVCGAKDFVLDITAGTLDLLRVTFKPALVTRGGVPKPLTAKLTDEQKKMVQEHCAVIPVDVKLDGDTLTVTLKWLRDRPVKLPVLKVILNENEFSDAAFTSQVADNIVIQHQLSSNVTTSQISSLKLSLIDDAVNLQISVEKLR